MQYFHPKDPNINQPTLDGFVYYTTRVISASLSSQPLFSTYWFNPAVWDWVLLTIVVNNAENHSVPFSLQWSSVRQPSPWWTGRTSWRNKTRMFGDSAALMHTDTQMCWHASRKITNDHKYFCPDEGQFLFLAVNRWRESFCLIYQWEKGPNTTELLLTPNALADVHKCHVFIRPDCVSCC